MNDAGNARKLDGACNFRDLGGFETKEGRILKHGMIFRSDELSRLTESDLEFLAGIPLRTIIDLRTNWEIARRPDKKPSTVQNISIFSLDTPRILGTIANVQDDPASDHTDENPQALLGNMDAELGALSAEQLHDAVVKLYERMTTEPNFIAVYRKIFALLLQEQSVPLLFHCMAGKDRTGIVAALILSALEVDEESIVEDYLLSNIVAEERYAKTIAKNETLQYLYKAYPEYLRASFVKIRSDHGTVYHYLEETLHVDTEKLKERYLV